MAKAKKLSNIGLTTTTLTGSTTGNPVTISSSGVIGTSGPVLTPITTTTLSTPIITTNSFYSTAYVCKICNQNIAGDCYVLDYKLYHKRCVKHLLDNWYENLKKNEDTL